MFTSFKGFKSGSESFQQPRNTDPNAKQYTGTLSLICRKRVQAEPDRDFLCAPLLQEINIFLHSFIYFFKAVRILLVSL